MNHATRPVPGAAPMQGVNFSRMPPMSEGLVVSLNSQSLRLSAFAAVSIAGTGRTGFYSPFSTCYDPYKLRLITIKYAKPKKGEAPKPEQYSYSLPFEKYMEISVSQLMGMVSRMEKYSKATRFNPPVVIFHPTNASAFQTKPPGADAFEPRVFIPAEFARFLG